MKIVHFECGLGNQLACFANYLLVKENNPDDEVYIEDLVYRIAWDNIGFNQWNGFELKDVFDIDLPNVIDVVDDKESLLRFMEQEYKKNDGQNNSYSAVTALRNAGFVFDIAGVYQQESKEDGIRTSLKHKVRRYVVHSSGNIVSYHIKRQVFNLLRRHRKYNMEIYSRSDKDLFYPLSFDLMKYVSALSPIESKLRKALTFPEIVDEENKAAADKICGCNSVSIHVRRSDFLQFNNDCYKYGFFNRAVRYIKKHVSDPEFFIFSEDSEWCKTHLEELGLNGNDKVSIIDWNLGVRSSIDMQLMSMCKHNIISKSSFGWWGAYLNSNPGKIIVSPVSEYYSTVYL